MALKATVCKATLNISDLRRHYYGDHTLTLARHPSETDERMMVRLLAFALNAHEDLQFTRGLSTDDEPDLWRKSLTGDIELWCDVGRPGADQVRKACNRSVAVHLYVYGGRAAAVWWRQQAPVLSGHRNLSVFEIPEAQSRALTGLAGRNMQLQCTIDDDETWFTDGNNSVRLQLDNLRCA